MARRHVRRQSHLTTSGHYQLPVTRHHIGQPGSATSNIKCWEELSSVADGNAKIVEQLLKTIWKCPPNPLVLGIEPKGCFTTELHLLYFFILRKDTAKLLWMASNL